MAQKKNNEQTPRKSAKTCGDPIVMLSDNKSSMKDRRMKK